MSHSHGSEVHGPDYHEVAAIHPAGASDSASHHGHTIMSASTLMIVLLSLVGMTLLTVGAALLETFLVDTFHVQPGIASAINITICLAIAVVKTTLVVLFFMQLKYDNPINGMIFIFCLCTVACFLGFTMLDLGNRATIDRFKGVYVSNGGSGLATYAAQEATKDNKDAQITTAKPITDIAKDVAVINRKFDAAEAGPHGHGAKHVSPFSNSNQSRPLKGMPDDAEETPAH